MIKVKIKNKWRDFNCKVLGFHRTYALSPDPDNDNAFCTWCNHEIDDEEFNRLRLNEIRNRK